MASGSELVAIFRSLASTRSASHGDLPSGVFAWEGVGVDNWPAYPPADGSMQVLERKGLATDPVLEPEAASHGIVSPLSAAPSKYVGVHGVDAKTGSPQTDSIAMVSPSYGGAAPDHDNLLLTAMFYLHSFSKASGPGSWGDMGGIIFGWGSGEIPAGITRQKDGWNAGEVVVGYGGKNPGRPPHNLAQVRVQLAPESWNIVILDTKTNTFEWRTIGTRTWTPVDLNAMPPSHANATGVDPLDWSQAGGEPRFGVNWNNAAHGTPRTGGSGVSFALGLVLSNRQDSDFDIVKGVWDVHGA